MADLTALAKHLPPIGAKAQAVVKLKQIDESLPSAGWLELLSELSRFDEASDKRRERSKHFSILSGIGLGVGIIFSLVLAANEAFHGPYGSIVMAITGGLLLILVVLLGYHLRQFLAYRALDLTNDFRQTLLPFLSLLADDVKPEALVRLALDLSGNVPRKKVSERQVPHPSYLRLEEITHVDPWCLVSAPLFGGHRLTLRLENTLIELKRTYHTSRGKVKTKSKFKKLIEATATLAPDEETLRFDPARLEAASLQGKVKLLERQDSTRLRVVRRFVFKSAGSPPVDCVPARELLALFAQICSRLVPSSVRS